MASPTDVPSGRTPPDTDTTDPDPTTAADPAEPVEVAAPPVTRDKHLHQIDLVRLVTFGGVILDHVMLGVAAPANVAAGAIETLLRYTRYGFFALTGFVLTYQYRNRELNAWPFWRRRYKLIGLPFLVWSLLYWLYGHYLGGGLTGIADTVASLDAARLAAKSLVYDLITGSAWYHLYFLSVSMQIYAIFPALLWVMRKTWGYHRYLLVASFAFHSVLLYLMVRPQHGFLVEGPVGVLWRHLEITLLPYQFFILSGALAAMHFEAFSRFTKRFRWAVLGVGAIVIAATLIYFLELIDRGESMFRATNVFMLHNTFAYIAIIAMLYCIGTIWQERRRAGSIAARFMRTAADRSFGIYLAHAVALSVVQPTVLEDIHAPTGLEIVLAYAAVVAMTIAIVEVLRRSPISLITTGRSTLDWRTQTPAKSLPVGVLTMAAGLAVHCTFSPLAGSALFGTGLLLTASSAWVLLKQRRSDDIPAAA
ncbi:acyltransferase [Williamsia herbipolensis]|uniref:acyltransferase n=1 Tax=Williamsia herbipolensis TaxID=1603258 RepID=UPI0005F86CC1|nr:acyltransferase [Williamsia herbipolensis]